MLFVFVLNIFTVLSAAMSSVYKNDFGLRISFLLIFLFFALRYDFGNDYMAYLNDMQNYKNGGDIYYKGYEYGWMFLYYFFAPFGFFSLQIFIASLHSFVFYFFIKNFVDRKYYWFAVFILVFHPGITLILSSAMRQHLAVLFFILSIWSALRNKYFLSIILIFISLIFHSSASFLFLSLAFIYVFRTFGYLQIFILGVLFFITAYFRESVLEFIVLNMVDNESIYIDYVRDENQATTDNAFGLGVALKILEYFVFFIFAQLDKNSRNVVFYNLVFLSLVITLLGFIGMPLVGRINFYYYPMLMIAFPLIFRKINNILLRYCYIVFLILFTLYNFLDFFRSPVYMKAFGEYHTIFSA